MSVFGALFSHALVGNLPANLAADAASLSPAAVHALAQAQQQAYLLAFSGAMDGVFLVACGVAGVAFGLSWLLQELPLRKAVSA